MLELGMPTLLALPSIADCAALCRELGLQFVELNMNLPQYQPDRVEPGLLQKLAERYGIYYTLHLDENLNISDFNAHVADAWTRTVLESIDLAKRLHIPVLNMHLSRGVYFTMPEKKVFLFDAYREEYLKGMAGFREKCEKAICGADVKICIENSSGYTDFQIQALDLLLESPVFALTYDIGHNHAIGGGDEPVIMERRAKLAHFHFHDAQGSKNHLPLGTGEIDIRKYLTLARDCHGRVVLETKTAEGLKESVKWMNQSRNQLSPRPEGAALPV